MINQRSLRVVGSRVEGARRFTGVWIVSSWALVALTFLPGAAEAQCEDEAYDRGGDNYEYDAGYEYADDTAAGFGIKLGAGFTASPESFLMDLGIPYHLGSGVSIGPRLQLGLAKDTNFVAPTINVEYSHDWSNRIGGVLGAIRPLISAGLGFAWVEDQDRNGDNSQTDVLFNVGVGLAYPLSEKFEIATVLDFNILPKEPLDDDFVFSWQLLQMRLQF